MSFTQFWVPGLWACRWRANCFARGKHVRVVNRGGRAPAGVDVAAEFVGADLYSPQDVARVAQGAAAAYQCAQPHYWEWPQKFPPCRLQSSRG